ncbi:hypothetical protein CAPTEDRAFT_162401 [Capitella teleta]|uniref:26S proteasome non-ATPase regulatory subunit 8 n=1 Tax=Capitella teleta TaxID=283909 RepID=R7UN64_CAPTE|nr:hypothetical protein CAPTEDRAFT_162401 [Capitella teleta]|eukprot:ELU07645.1 hypothetical protein CAPTEDRAFT_162401 [Capitella teleta]
MADLKAVIALYQNLSQEWDRKPPNLDKCGDILAKLKVGLTQLTFLPTDESSVSKRELLVARDILEVGAQWAIAKKDVEAFERYMAQLKCYYLDYKEDLPESAYKFQLLGLNLLRLLAQNKLADFHTELELLPANALQQNVYIKHPVSIEQYLMEGSYNKVFLARGNVPADSYNFFIDILLDTIREEIAGCLEKAYEKIAISEAARMLFFDSEKPMREYSAGRNWTKAADGYFHFVHEEKKTDDDVPAMFLATQTIGYAKELDMIV